MSRGTSVRRKKTSFNIPIQIRRREPKQSIGFRMRYNGMRTNEERVNGDGAKAGPKEGGGKKPRKV